MTVQVVDLRGVPCELPSHRWTAHIRRDPARLRGIVLHQWGTPVGTRPESRALHGEAVALARRGLRAPYAVNAGATRAGRPVVGLCHPLERYTYASDAGNREYLAVAVMGLFPFTEAERTSRHSPLTDALVAAVDEALVQAVHLLDLAALGEGDAGGPWSLLTHRQCINGPGDHAWCPGEAVVAAALRSRPVADGLLVPDPDTVLVPEFGKPWPAEWRRHLTG